jgi:transcriptional regulator with XRE-family HTH domain
MITGADIRRYRKSIGLSQVEFAEQLGLSQSGLSQLESGRIAVSDEHLVQLKDRFSDQDFEAYLSARATTRDASRQALTATTGKYLSLAVYLWEEGYDLGQVPSPEQVVDMVTIRATSNATIAFQMPRESVHWVRGEILVFEECRPADVIDEDICLIQIKPPRARTPKTVLAAARLTSKRGSLLQLTLIAPRSPTLSARDETIRTLMRTVFRGRRV